MLPSLLYTCALGAAALALPQDPYAELFGATLHFGDFDRDGAEDIYVTDPVAGDRLLHNRGGGLYEDVTATHGLDAGARSLFALWFDLDTDGALDLCVGGLDGSLRLLQNADRGHFVDVTPTTGLQVEAVGLDAEARDLDGDGRVDLHVSTELGGALFRNAGAGRFERLRLPEVELAALLGAAEALGVDSTAGPDAPLGGGQAGAQADADPSASRAAAARARRSALAARLGAAGAGGPGAAGDASTVPGPPTTSSLLTACAIYVDDQATANCIQTSSVPTLGMLYPLSANLFVATNGRVGVGTTTPPFNLSVTGTAGVDVGDANFGTNEHTLKFGNQITGEAIGSKRTIGGNRFGLDFYTQSQNRLAITNAGSVGIGTNDSGAEAILVLENFAHTFAQVAAHTKVKHVVVAAMGDLLGLLKGTLVNLVVRHVKKMVPPYALPNAVSFNGVIAAGRRLNFTPPAIGPDDIAFLQYTGGTTGVSKGATLSHRNVVANTLQAEAWLQPALMREPRDEQLFILVALPLYHIFALTACALLGMRNGAVSLLIPNPRDIPNLISELSKYPVSYFPAVNTLFNALLNHADFGKLKWSHLKASIGGGMAVQQLVAERWLETTGTPIIEAYGLSETSPGLTANRCDITEWTGTIGLPFPSTDISIRDDGNKEVATGERGEICARGPQLMVGYWNRPDETAKMMTPDGFFRTGDIGVMDDQGRFKIVDRKKDMISVSGFKVYPNEVEDIAMMQGNVMECAVVGVPDEHSSEAVKLFVVKKSPDLTEQDLRGYMHSKLASYKMPKYIEFRTELPKTNVGKILRRALRDGA